MYMMFFDDRYIPNNGNKGFRRKLSLTLDLQDKIGCFRDEYVLSSVDKKLNVDLTLIIWNIIGQEEFHELRRYYYEGASSDLIICDVTKDVTFTNSRLRPRPFFIYIWYSLKKLIFPLKFDKLLSLILCIYSIKNLKYN
ncbi:MAG: hypothetical protein AB1779_09295 [Candidatus Thermoplasmatota archaeon]